MKISAKCFKVDLFRNIKP